MLVQNKVISFQFIINKKERDYFLNYYLKKFMKKYLIGSAIVLSLIVGVGAQTASALTSAEAEAIIAALSLDAGKAAVIRALVTPGTGGTTMSASFGRQLGVGSRGDDVTALQSW